MSQEIENGLAGVDVVFADNFTVATLLPLKAEVPIEVTLVRSTAAAESSLNAFSNALIPIVFNVFEAVNPLAVSATVAVSDEEDG